MNVGFKNHKTERLRKLFLSFTTSILFSILVTGCAERPPSAINPDNNPPMVTIISPAAVEIENTPVKNDAIKTLEKTSEADLVLAESKRIAERPREILSIPKKATEDQVVQRKNENDKAAKKNSGTVYKKGVELVFKGQAVDVEEDSISETSLRWTSDKEGEIGTGYTFTKSDLSVGEHQIVLYATDSEGGVGRDTVNITIKDQTEVLENKLPVAEILSISGIDLLEDVVSLNLQEIGEVVLNGTGTDEEDGTLDGESLKWSSNIDGELGTGSTLDVTDLLTIGNHTITLTATDSKGATDSESVDISIEDGVNKLPVAEILSVAGIESLSDGLNLNLQKIGEVILEGTGSDEEDGILEGESLVWSSDIDEVLGTGSTLDATELLSVGSHTITLTATDSEGAIDSESVDISIEDGVNKLPVAEILSVAGIESLSEGISLNLQEIGEVILSGTGTDEEDGILEGESLVWSSSIDGQLGTGGTLDATDLLSVGSHTITLTATDSEGATDSESVDISIEDGVNKLPVAEILSVAGIESLSEGISLNLQEIGDHLILEGRGSDEEDGTLEGESLEWISDSGEILGTGATLEIPASDLSLGDHTITFTATDNDGAIAEDHVNITILDPLPSAPTGLGFEVLSSHGIQLNWTDNSNNETGFIIEQSLNNEILNKIQTDENVITFSLSDLSQGAYHFRVAAENSYGTSEYSQPIELTIPLRVTNFVSQDYTLESTLESTTVDSTNELTIGVLDLDLLTENYAVLRFDNIMKEIEGRNIKKAGLYLELNPNSSFENRKTFSADAIFTNWNDPVELTDKYELAGLAQTIEMTSSTEQQVVFNITSIVEKWASRDLVNNGLIVQMEKNLTSVLSLVDFESLETSREKNDLRLAPRIIVEFEN